jgi:hypothetical protein
VKAELKAQAWCLDDKVRGGLVLGGDDLLAKARAILKTQSATDSRWRLQGQEAATRRAKLAALLKKEPDEDVRIWLETNFSDEKKLDVARRHGYKDGNGVTQLVKRLERRKEKDAKLRDKLTAYRTDLALIAS